MRIREAFATAITDRIEPVVKVLDRKPGVIAGELDSLVVTPQWERFLRQALDAYTDAATRDDEDGIGIWISGFFGSGKSLLMKVLGVLLEGGAVDGLGVRQRFLARVPTATIWSGTWTCANARSLLPSSAAIYTPSRPLAETPWP